MKALPTDYAGTIFRSRLEADWAATLDQLGISWQYEPEGFELSTGEQYLPDFYLPDLRAWLEVKGDHMKRTGKVEQFAADLWDESDCDVTTDPKSPLVALGLSPRFQMANVLGVRGIGKKYSVSIFRCNGCYQNVINTWNGAPCRICGFAGDDGCLFGEPSMGHDWTRVPRPNAPRAAR